MSHVDPLLGVEKINTLLPESLCMLLLLNKSLVFSIKARLFTKELIWKVLIKL